MITDRNAAEPAPRLPLSLWLPWLSRWRIVLFLALGTVGAGLALNWDWLTAVGAAPILLSLAPCAAMCALGLCMRGGGARTCATHGKADAASQSLHRPE